MGAAPVTRVCMISELSQNFGVFCGIGNEEEGKNEKTSCFYYECSLEYVCDGSANYLFRGR